MYAFFLPLLLRQKTLRTAFSPILPDQALLRDTRLPRVERLQKLFLFVFDLLPYDADHLILKLRFLWPIRNILAGCRLVHKKLGIVGPYTLPDPVRLLF